MFHMNAVLLGVIGVLAIGAYSATIGDEPKPFFAGDDYIIGGLIADRGQFSHHASLRVRQSDNQFRHVCSGAIITDRVIVSVAQCFPTELLSSVLENFQLVFGSITRSGKSGTVYTVQKVIIHPEYNHTSLLNDIALVQTVDDIQLSGYVFPIVVSTRFVTDNRGAVVSGWGRNNDTHAPLRYNYIDTITNDECRRRITKDDPPVHDFSTLCAYSHQYETGVTDGDWGGPLQLKNWLIGVSSWEYSRAHRFPDGFTRLSEHVPWIIDQVDGNCEDSCSFVKTSEVLMFVKKK